MRAWQAEDELGTAREGESEVSYNGSLIEVIWGQGVGYGRGRGVDNEGEKRLIAVGHNRGPIVSHRMRGVEEVT